MKKMNKSKEIIDLYNDYQEERKKENKEKIIDELLLRDDVHNIISTQINSYIKKNNTAIEYKRDLFQVALKELYSAFINFDIKRNVDINIYLSESVKNAILNAMYSYTDLKKSRGVLVNLKVLKSLLDENTDLKTVKTKFKEKTGIKNDKTVNNYFLYLNQGYNPISLNNTINKAKSLNRIDIVESNELDPEKQFVKDSLNQILINYLNKELSKRENEFIKDYIGLNGKAMSMSDIARKNNVSKQYVSNTIKKGLEKLKKSSLKEEINNLKDIK